MFNDNSNLRKKILKKWQEDRNLVRVYLDNNISLTGYVSEHDDAAVLLELQGQDKAFTLIDRAKTLSICSEAYLGKTSA